MRSASLLLLVAACSGTVTTPAQPDKARQQCEDLLGKWCSKATDCLVEGKLIADTDAAYQRDACLSGAHQQVDCSKAVAVKTSYDACMADIDAIACQSIVDAVKTKTSLTLPSTCNGVILVQSSLGAESRSPLVEAIAPTW